MPKKLSPTKWLKYKSQSYKVGKDYNTLYLCYNYMGFTTIVLDLCKGGHVGTYFILSPLKFEILNLHENLLKTSLRGPRELIYGSK